ncbi:MAG: nucleotidyl transferase AbiEii/AbiGii toxin family protein [bacterium]|nr:nucleotidyl transferase AbiEii/AbiGii toxin family protein [bacterium]
MLTALQERTWRIIAALPEADGFALAGGSALILTGVVQRETSDIDVFGAYPRSAIPFAEAAQRVLTSEGLNPTVERWGDGFVRMRVTDGADTTYVDIAIDARRHPTVADPTGQVLNIRELAADKMLALVGRVAPRYYIDMWAITQRHHISDVIDWASDIPVRQRLGSLGRQPRSHVREGTVRPEPASPSVGIGHRPRVMRPRQRARASLGVETSLA